jgi:capsid protein
VYEAWLEEQIDTGRIKFPNGLYGFLQNRLAAARADWRGPPKPQADDLKMAKAHQTYKSMGVMSDEMICNDLGVDVEDVYAQRAHEMKLRDKYELPEGDTMAPENDPEVNALLKQSDHPSGGSDDNAG